MKNPIVATKSNLSTESKATPGSTKAEDDILKAALAMSEVKIPQPSCASRGAQSSAHKSSGVLSSSGASKPRERIIPVKVEGRDTNESEDEDDENVQLARALQMSLQSEEDDVDKTLKLRLDLRADNTTSATHLANSTDDTTDEDDELRRALQLSLECVTAPPTPDPEDIRWRRLNHFAMYNTRTPNSEAPAKLNT